MNLIKKGKSSEILKKYEKYIVAGLQILILLIAVSSWLFHRGGAYGRAFEIDDFIVSDTAVTGEDISMDASSGPGVLLSTPALSLKKGIYQIQVDYAVNSPGSSVSVSSGLGTLEMICPSVELNPSSYSTALTLDIARGTDDIVIQVSFSGEGNISISHMGVYETSSLYKKNIFKAVLLCLFISIFHYFIRSDVRIRRIMLALAGIFLLSCYPLYNDYLTVGHDLPFHLLRIEAISQGLANGIFPVKLHPLWANGQGYAVGIFYGDALLYFPALLRLLGFSIQSAYKIFLAAINLGTILISYYCFRKMFSDEKTGLLGCTAYTFAQYRLMDTYTRASVGEYTSMMVLPLLLYGFYMIFQNKEGKKWWRYSILTAFGLTGLIQSHVLSTVMICFVILTVCILLCRRIFKKYVFRSLACAAVLALLLNLCFIVPFLDFYGEDIMINSPEWTGRTAGSFQECGLFPIQLFSLFYHSSGGAWFTAAGIGQEASYGIGILLVIGMFLFLYLLCIHGRTCRNSRNFRPALLCMLLGCILLYMSTCYFPWDALASLGEAAENIIYSLQFPWRFLAPATVLLTFVLCYSYEMARSVMPKQSGLLAAGSLIILFVNCGWYFYDFSFNSEPYRVYTTSELYTMQMYSYDYLPVGTVPEEIRENAVYLDGVLPLENFRRQGTSITCDVSASQEGGYVEFPLLCYKYYQCTDVNTSQSLPVSPGTNNMVRVTLPASYSGSIQVSFREPWFWRAAEIVSLFTLAGTAAAMLLGKKRR